MGHGVKCRGIRIPNPLKAEAREHDTSKEIWEALMESLLGGKYLNCVGHQP